MASRRYVMYCPVAGNIPVVKRTGYGEALRRGVGENMLRFKRTIIAGLAVLCAASSMDAAAQAQDAPDSERRAPVSLDRLTRHTEVVKAFTVASITDVVIELGFTASVAAIEGDYPLILVRDERGAGFALQPMVCDGTDPDDECHGLLLIVALQRSARFPGISISQVNRFNDLQFYGRGHVTGRGAGPDAGEAMAILSRLILSDYGTTRGNLGVELTTFRSATYNYAHYLSQLRIADNIADSRGGNGGGENALSQVRSPLQSQGFVANGAAALSADLDADLPRLPHLIEQWGRTGILKDFQFPAEALAGQD